MYFVGIYSVQILIKHKIVYYNSYILIEIAAQLNVNKFKILWYNRY